jgi:hypothetical protein
MSKYDYNQKTELPIYIVAVLIFLASLGFLAFAVYYIAFLPVPVAMQPLKSRILTTLQVEEVAREKEEVVETLVEEEGENLEEGNLEN